MIESSSASIGKDSLRTFGAMLLSFTFALLTGIAVARWLGPSGKGAYSGLQLMVTVVTSLTAGFGASITYALTKQRRRLSELLPALGALWLIVVALVWATDAVWLMWRGVTLAGLLFGAAVPAAVLLSWQQSFYVGVGRLRSFNLQTVGLAAGTLVAVAAALVVLHQGITVALAVWVGALYVTAAIVAAHARRLAGALEFGHLRKTAIDIVRFGVPTAFNAFLGALNYRIDSLLLIALLGTAPFGVYSVAVGLGEAHFMITRPVATAVSRDIGLRDLSSSAAMTAMVIRVCTAIVAAVALVVFFVGPALVGVVYGVAFSGIAAPLRFLLPGIVAFSTTGTFCSFFLFQLGRPLLVTYVNLAMIAVQAAACLALVPRLGMSGAALASTATYIAGACLNTALFCRATGLSVTDVWVVRRQDLSAVARVALRLAMPAAKPRAGSATLS